jgi:hypothetical protein
MLIQDRARRNSAARLRTPRKPSARLPLSRAGLRMVIFS